MQARERHVSRPEKAALSRASAAETTAARSRAETARLARDLADMREDRDRWRAQAERLTAALEKLRTPSAAPPTPEAGRHREGADTLYGAEAIAGHLGVTTRQARHLISQGLLPTFKMGRRVCALRSKLTARLAQQGDN